MSSYFSTLTVGSVLQNYPTHLPSYAFVQGLNLDSTNKARNFTKSWLAFACCCFVANRYLMLQVEASQKGRSVDSIHVFFRSPEFISVSVSCVVDSLGGYIVSTDQRLNGHLGGIYGGLDFNSSSYSYSWRNDLGQTVTSSMFRDLFAQIPYLRLNWYNLKLPHSNYCWTGALS